MFDQIKNDYGMKEYIKIKLGLNPHAEKKWIHL